MWINELIIIIQNKMYFIITWNLGDTRPIKNIVFKMNNMCDQYV